MRNTVKSKKRMEVRKSEKLASALAKFDSHAQVEVIGVGYPGISQPWL